MTAIEPHPKPRVILLTALLACCTALSASAQTSPASLPATIPAILLSDIHLDPFHDPAKAARLAAAPTAQWSAILAEPDSPTRDADFAALQKSCGATHSDTPYPLLVSALRAAHAQQPNPLFLTLTGDLVVHNFDCLFHTLLPHRRGEDFRSFVEKTQIVVGAELRFTFPNTPIYVTLGNNDSACGDYQFGERSIFLHDIAPLFITDLARIPAPARTAALADFEQRGSFSATMPAPMQNTRLVAFNDVYLSSKYVPCPTAVHTSTPSATPAAAMPAQQLAWLRAQIEDARRRGQQVWVLGHIPPGVDLYSTVAQARDVCNGQRPEMFLSSADLDNTLLAGSGVIRLALFAHTHMDEMRLLQSGAEEVPIKLIPSISPVNGNAPSFTTARVDPATATLVDYTVYTASNHTGIAATWSREYNYAETYHQPDFSAAALHQLFTGLRADRNASTSASRAYLGNYFAGDKRGLQLAFVWPAYTCTLTHTSAQSFSACLCPNPK